MPNSSNPTQLKNFLPLSKLGQGAFSTVYKVKRANDGQVYALKKIKMQKLNEKQKLNALNQIRILASIKSKHIISYKEAFYDQTLNLLCIVMEYANNGDMHKKIANHQKAKHKFIQKQIWKAASQILIGLYVLHEKGILHRDLKSANVFVANDQYKLGDLNVSKVNYQKDQMAKTQTGTPYYASPEVWRDQPYDSKCDIWSFGCLIYEMCCFDPPFQGADLDELYKAVQKGKYRQIPSVYSCQLGFLIKSCLRLNAKQRPSAKQLFLKFKHLKQKFMQSIRDNQFQVGNDLLSTIRLPLDLKDLSKELPVPEYEILIKEQPRTIYQLDSTNRETMMLKNKATVDKKIEPLPDRIKNYFKQDNKIPIKKRPQRPVTSSKKNQPKNQKHQVRPSSAQYLIRKNKESQKIAKSTSRRENKTGQKMKPEGQFRVESLQNKVIAPLKNNYNPSQYRCKSSEYQRNQKNFIALNSPSNNLKIKNQSCHYQPKKGRQNSLSQQESQIDPCLQQNFQINQKIYENCKENSLKKISSLEKKVKYIRDQRKQRKAILQKNKENMSCIIKPSDKQQSLDIKQKLRDKIKQNSQILINKPSEKIPLYMPVIKERIRSGVSVHYTHNPSERIQNIQNHLEKRKKNLVNRRYIASADSKRVRSYTEISNDQSSYINDGEKYKKYGIIRKIPSNLLPSLFLDKIPRKNISSQPYMKQEPLVQMDFHNIRREELIQSDNIIDNSETIIRLKKRIKNRMICHESQQKSNHSFVKQNSMKLNPIYN